MAVRGLHPDMFRDNDFRVSMGMLRRAGSLLACIAKERLSTHLIPFQERILDLSMSRALDAEVQSHLSSVLYNNYEDSNTKVVDSIALQLLPVTA